MKLGLVAGGASVKACVAGLQVADSLGPIAAPTYRLASRIANSLRAGYAVSDYTGLADVRLVLLCVPPVYLRQTTSELVASGLDWRRRTVLYSGGRAGSCALSPLRDAGAATGSINEVEGVPGYFVLEGDSEAVRQGRRLVSRRRGKAVQLAPGAMPLFFAGLSFASVLFTPLVEASLECLRLAGAGPQAASQIAELLLTRSLRAHKNGGLKSWSGALPSGDEDAVFEQLKALESMSELLASYYRQSSFFALEFFKRHSELAEKLGKRPRVRGH